VKNEKCSAAQQHEVQRLLGRCLLRLQQYEHLLKTVLAHHELAGPMQQLEALRAARIDDLATNTLGTLVKALFESYVVVDGIDRSVLDDTNASTDSAAFGFRLSIGMSEERVAQTKESLKALVSLRNEMVHHLTERFDVSTVAGCLAASEFLTDGYVHIDKCLETLREWATHTEKTRQLAASFACSDAFRNFLVDGIELDGRVDWPRAGIVLVLREAIDALAVSEWICLDDAISWIAERHPEQVPAKYGCRSWQQVLHESRLFGLKYIRDASGRNRAWFRLGSVKHEVSAALAHDATRIPANSAS
jgi:hypothetical protein